eukprot:SAG11_NODE_137_length_15114_cov_2.297303_5_plen_284_part_00
MSLFSLVFDGCLRARRLLGGRYVITGDTLLKMMATYMRMKCGVPVILLGECGCGKTYLISYLCQWIEADLLVLDVNGGTSVSDIEKIFAEAAATFNKDASKDVYVFLDEVNTCSHMGLISEIVCHRSLGGKRLPERVKVLAALNPYRRRPAAEATPGLVYQLHSGSTPDPMAALVYRVHPIPGCLADFIFDFGSLSPEIEAVTSSSSFPSFPSFRRSHLLLLVPLRLDHHLHRRRSHRQCRHTHRSRRGCDGSPNCHLETFVPFLLPGIYQKNGDGHVSEEKP